MEICNNNVWGTVCDDAWGNIDAQVACNQLGYTNPGATAITLGDVTDGTGQIWLDNVQCTGTETRLIDCPRNALGSHNCGHSEDAGVNCISKFIFLQRNNSSTIMCVYAVTVCTHGDIRLQGGTARSGRVEICNNGVWGTVCDDLWGTADAQVSCRQLGFTSTGNHSPSAVL